jgi:hypothetical protein
MKLSAYSIESSKPWVENVNGFVRALLVGGNIT